jgi:2-C-methyl-D-erythritol 4-phosphate cytidylyltransferase
MSKNKIIAVLLAGGKGERMGVFQKQFVKIESKPILSYSIDVMLRSGSIDKVIVTVPKEKSAYAAAFLHKMYGSKKIIVIEGGKTRRFSSYNALKHIKANESGCEYVLFHDGVRPLISRGMVGAVINSAKKYGAAVLGMGVLNVIAAVKNGFIVEALNPRNLRNTQTPHCYKFKWILEAHESEANKGRQFDSLENIEIMHRYGKKIRIIEDFYRNMKLTYKQDIVPIRALLRRRNSDTFYRMKTNK